MPTTPQAKAVQMLMDLHLTEGEFANVEIRNEDIGGELLPLLSKGLYTNPLHCIREYVQNSVDAAAKQATIKVTGNSVIIYDDGKGMSLGELIQARQFGVSTKDSRLNVGFRGIGIYSGFDLCNRLLITTKKVSEKYAYILEFDFGAMKAQLAEDAKSGASRTPLNVLLESYSRFSQESEQVDLHYTIVQLEDISDVHIKELSDRAELRRYILRNLPIDFDEEFPHRVEVNKRLKKEVPGYNAVTVILESDNMPREVVAKPNIPFLDEPLMDKVINKNGDTIAFYWACLRKPPAPSAPPTDQPNIPRGRIPDEYADFRGFIYKVKGFSIGSNTKLLSVFKKGNAGLYWWFAGEVYVIDPEVVPNAARDDFETNPAQRALESRVHDALKKLEDIAGKYQEEARALQKFSERQSDLDRLSIAIASDSYSDLEAYSELDDIIRELKSQKSRLPSDRRNWGADHISLAEKLKKQVKGEIDNPQPSPQQRREAVKHRGEPTQPPNAELLPPPQPQAQPTSVQLRQLSEIIQDSGWALPEDAIPIIDIINNSLADVLGGGSEMHRAVLLDVEAKLSAEFSG